ARSRDPARRGAGAGDALRQPALRARRGLEIRRLRGDLPRLRRRPAQRLPRHPGPLRRAGGVRLRARARRDPRPARRPVRARRARGRGARRRTRAAGVGRPARRIARPARAEPVAGRTPRPPGRPARHARGRGARRRRVRGRRARRPRALPDPRRRGRRAAACLPGRPRMNRPDPRTGFDQRQVRRAFSRAAHGYDAASALQRAVEAQLLESLEFWPAKYGERLPERVLDLGSGPGRGAMALRKRWPKARVLAIDLALPMLREARRREGWNPLRRGIDRICADATALPLAPESLDLLFSNLCLQWVEDLPAVLAGFRRALGPGGRLRGSALGGARP